MKKGNGNSLGYQKLHGFSFEWMGFLLDFQGLPAVREHLASLMGLPVSQMDDLVRKVIGMSYKELILRLKLLKSLAIIPHTSFSPDEAARCCGFSNSASFSRSFKKVFGFSPNKLRTMASKKRDPGAYV